jgi:phosphatidylserine/phosphatidylglycerophosphate/cardiolipin synthase-like enzyme
MPWWPLSPMTLMWIQVATGFTGAMTFIHMFKVLARKMGHIPSVGAHFSPKGSCQEALVKELQGARREILVQAYSFTNKAITEALVEAKKRGVHVLILLDRSNEVEKYSDLHIVMEQNLDPLIDAEHPIAHNKIMIIDQKTIVTGSYNFTHQAEAENAENMLIIKGHPDLVQQYRANLMKHKEHCRPAQLKEPKEFRHEAKKPEEVKKAA